MTDIDEYINTDAMSSNIKRKRDSEEGALAREINVNSETISIPDLFYEHTTLVERLAVARRGKLELRLVTRQDINQYEDRGDECVVFRRYPSDKFVGCARLRAVHALLSEMDCRGWAAPLTSSRLPLLFQS